MRPKLLIVFLLLAAACTGCLRKDPARPQPRPLDSTVHLAFAERLPERTLEMSARTEREYPCYNYALETSVMRLTDRTRVQFGQVLEPVGCLTALGPARSETILGRFGDGGNPFQLRGTTGSADLSLEVSGGAYRFVGKPPARVVFDTPELRRIPGGTVWGYVGTPGPEWNDEVDAALADLEATGARPRTLAGGSYEVRFRSEYGELGDRFEVVGGAIVRPVSHPRLRSFAFEFEGDLEALRAAVRHVELEHAGALDLAVFTWNGDVLQSWVLGRS